ncbi:hypothetical protein PAXRUDRAFT_161094, partial [Paxillus rubicundulus Ve08.2h10]
LPPIYWDKQHSTHTDCLVKWCQKNPNAHLQLFSDSAQGAKEEGCHEEQACHTKNACCVWLAKAIVGQDDNSKFCTYSKNSPSFFNAVSQCCLASYSNGAQSRLRQAQMAHVHACLVQKCVSNAAESKWSFKKYVSPPSSCMMFCTPPGKHKITNGLPFC